MNNRKSVRQYDGRGPSLLPFRAGRWTGFVSPAFLSDCCRAAGVVVPTVVGRYPHALAPWQAERHEPRALQRRGRQYPQFRSAGDDSTLLLSNAGRRTLARQRQTSGPSSIAAQARPLVLFGNFDAPLCLLNGYASIRIRVNSVKLACTGIRPIRRQEPMSRHKFKVGDLVAINPTMGRFVPSGVFEIIKQLPGSNEPEYHIKSTNEPHQRLARES